MIANFYDDIITALQKAGTAAVGEKKSHGFRIIPGWKQEVEGQLSFSGTIRNQFLWVNFRKNVGLHDTIKKSIGLKKKFNDKGNSF